MLISAGVLVRALAVERQLALDGAVELVRLSIDTSWPDDEEPRALERDPGPHRPVPGPGRRVSSGQGYGSAARSRAFCVSRSSTIATPARLRPSPSRSPIRRSRARSRGL